MSTDMQYLLQLHRNGVITDDDLRKGIRALDEKKVEEKPDVKSSTLGNLRKRRNNKKDKKRQKKKYDNVMKELKQVFTKRKEPVSELQLVDKPLCNYFKAYQIDADRYKDPINLFNDKKAIIVEQINKDIKEYNKVHIIYSKMTKMVNALNYGKKLTIHSFGG